MTLSGNNNGVPIVAQAPGSLTTHASGSLSLNLLDPAHASLLPGGQITLDNLPGTFQPDGLAGNFAGLTTSGGVTTYGRWDGIQLSIGITSPLSIDAQGHFDASQLSLILAGGQRDLQRGVGKSIVRIVGTDQQSTRLPGIAHPRGGQLRADHSDPFHAHRADLPDIRRPDRGLCHSPRAGHNDTVL